MPAKSKAQYNLMRAAEHSPSFAKKVGIKPSVAKEFADATKAPKRLPAKVKGKSGR
jgi:hypothetical protein